MYKGNAKVQKVMVQPINLIFRYLQNRAKIQVWLYENTSLRIEGYIIGEILSFSGKVDALSDLAPFQTIREIGCSTATCDSTAEVKAQVN